MWRFYWVYNPALLRFSLFHLLGPLLSLRFKFLSSLYLLNPSLSTFCPNWVYLRRRFFLYLSEVSEVLWTYHGWLCSISGYWQLECWSLGQDYSWQRFLFLHRFFFFCKVSFFILFYLLFYFFVLRTEHFVLWEEISNDIEFGKIQTKLFRPVFCEYPLSHDCVEILCRRHHFPIYEKKCLA